MSEGETYIRLRGFSNAYQLNRGNLLHMTLIAESGVCVEGKMELVAEVNTAQEKGWSTKMLFRDESEEWRPQDVTTLGRLSRIDITGKVVTK